MPVSIQIGADLVEPPLVRTGALVKNLIAEDAFLQIVERAFDQLELSQDPHPGYAAATLALAASTRA